MSTARKAVGAAYDISGGEMKEIGKIHGKYHTYVVQEKTSTFLSPKYYIVRDDGKSYGAFSSRADAFRAAHKEAGPDAYEST